MQGIGFREGGQVVSAGQIASLVIFLLVLAAIAFYLRRKPRLSHLLQGGADVADVLVSRKTIGPGVTWYKVTENGKTWVFVNNGQQLLKLDEFQVQQGQSDE